MADTAIPEASDSGVFAVLPRNSADARPVDVDIPEDDLLRIHRIMTLARALDDRGL